MIDKVVERIVAESQPKDGLITRDGINYFIGPTGERRRADYKPSKQERKQLKAQMRQLRDRQTRNR